ncbi:MAG: hypothetical protein ACI8RZ_003322, partial [Myxococcota bacterium]
TFPYGSLWSSLPCDPQPDTHRASHVGWSKRPVYNFIIHHNRSVSLLTVVPASSIR